MERVHETVTKRDKIDLNKKKGAPLFSSQTEISSCPGGYCKKVAPLPSGTPAARYPTFVSGSNSHPKHNVITTVLHAKLESIVFEIV